jgi:hypothetical protein
VPEKRAIRGSNPPAEIIWSAPLVPPPKPHVWIVTVPSAVSVKGVSNTSSGVLKVPVYEVSIVSALALAERRQMAESRNPHFNSPPERCICLILNLQYAE